MNLIDIFRGIEYTVGREEGLEMPNIKPISDLRNYTEEFDKLKAAVQLLACMEEGEKTAGEQGWVSAAEVMEVS